MRDSRLKMGKLGRLGLLWILLPFAGTLRADSPKPMADDAAFIKGAADHPKLLKDQTQRAYEKAREHSSATEEQVSILARLVLLCHQLDDETTLKAIKEDVQRMQVESLALKNNKNTPILTLGLSIIALHAEERKLAQGLVEEALQQAQQGGHPNTNLQVLTFASDLYYRLEMDQKSLQAILDAKYVMEKHPEVDPTLRLILESAIVQMNFEQERTLPNLRLLERYYHKIKAAHLRFQAGILAFFLADAWLHLPQPDNDNAFRYFQESLQTSLAIDDDYTAAASSYKLANLSNHRKDSHAALKYGMQTLTILKDKRSIWRYKNLRELAIAYLALNELDKAEQAILEVLRELKDEQLVDHIKANDVALSIYKKQGQLLKALETAQTIIRYTNELHRVQSKNEFTEKKVLLGLEASNLQNQILEKDRQLAQKDSLLKSIELQQVKRENTIKTILTIISLLGLLILTVLLLKVLRQRKRINELNVHLQTDVLGRFLPPSLVKDVVDKRIAWDDHAQQVDVTILFADIVNFTRTCENKSPQRITEIMNRFFSVMSQIIYSEQGTLDKFIGDAVMVLFGAPVGMEKSAQIHHAVACARKMQKALEKLCEELTSEDGTSFGMRIGIHHGPVVAGMFGSPQRSDYTALGMAVNIASRIEGKANPNQILVSRTVVDVLPRELWEPAGSFKLKGISENHELYSIQTDVEHFSAVSNE